MNFLSSPEPPHFNLLSLGQRGVGKTVFLAGSYAELNQASQSKNQQKLWFECENEEDKNNLNSILDYVKRTGKYPPPTLKITDFHFVLKQRSHKSVKTLCHFRWSDIPGEYCDFGHPDFQKMVLSSHSCCVFINGERLVKDPTYLHELEGLVKQVIAIATLIDRDTIDYGFALIFTQCDRLGSGPMSRLQIEENLQFLITSLEAAEAKYQRFYSGIPIVSDDNGSRFDVQGSAAAFLWIVSELQQNTQLNHQSNRALESSLKPDISSLQYWLPGSPQQLLPLVGIITALLGLTAVALLGLNRLSPQNNYSEVTQQYIKQLEQIVQKNPSDTESASTLVDQYLNQGELGKAINLLAKTVEKQPNNLSLQLKLANLYEITGETQQAEAVYDQILAQDSTYFKALWGKALIRNQEGDKVAAKALLQQAEKSASSEELKQRIQEAAKQLNIKL